MLPLLLYFVFYIILQVLLICLMLFSAQKYKKECKYISFLFKKLLYFPTSCM